MANGRAFRRNMDRSVVGTGTGRTGRRVAALAAAGGLLIGCGTDGGEDAAAVDDTTTTEAPATTTTTVPVTTTTEPPPTTTTTVPVTTTTEPPPTTTTTVPPPPTTTVPPPEPTGDVFRQGDRGDGVRALQEDLSDLGYWLGDADGVYGQTTQQAVMAFQKAEGLGRDGVAGPETRARLDGAGRPSGRSTAGRVIEIDLQRQLMLVMEDGRVVWALNTSTGRPGAGTPTGEYTIDREIDGWRHAPLGTLYRPKYFNQGIALHGADSIPAGPASAGCARLSNAATDMVWASGRAEIGTRVSVY